MNHLPAEFPSRPEGLALHLRLCDHDPVAPADVCHAYLNPLLARLAARFPHVDPDLRQSAVHQALIAYVQSPLSYDPARADLAVYLRMAAGRDLLNLLKREGKHHAGRVGWNVVEDGLESGNISGGEGPAQSLERAEEDREREAFLAAVAETFTEPERRALGLMLAGARKTEEFARALGLDGLPAAEQAREVKKVKDRIIKRLERGGRGHA